MSDSYDYDLVCIGSGPAGQRAAVQAAKLGQRAAVVEKRRAVGGVCIDTGTIPSKTLREAVLAFSGLAGKGDRLPGPGATRGRPASSSSRASTTSIAREVEVIESQLRRNDVDVCSGEASFVDPHTLRDRRGRRLAARSRPSTSSSPSAPSPAPPPGVGGRRRGHPEHRRHGRSSKQLPRTLAVVGAGVIGIEYASIFAALGVPVTLVERRERPLEFLDREIVDELIHQMRERNVTFRFGEAVESIEVADGPPRRAVLHLESGKRIVTDMVLFSAGRIAATDALDLAAAGLAADERGRMTVDDAFRTAVPNIFAAGDVIGYPEPRRHLDASRGAWPPARRSASRRGRWRRTSPSASTRSRRSPWWARPSTS